jgi:hypothetical protein
MQIKTDQNKTGSDANQTQARSGIAATIDFFPHPNLESIIQALEPHSINGTWNLAMGYGAGFTSLFTC